MAGKPPYVPLCKVKRYSVKSCFILFHEAATLFDPCCADAQKVMTVRAHTNRTLPPCRRVATAKDASSSASEEEDEEFIPENASIDDDDKSSKRPAIRRRTASKAIAIFGRRTSKTELLDMIEHGVVGKFRVSRNDYGDDQI